MKRIFKKTDYHLREITKFVDPKLLEGEIVISDEMRKMFYKKTNNHIRLVQKYCERIDNDFLELEGIILRGKYHDWDKLHDNKITTPYILITWKYYCRDNKLPFTVTEKMDK